jgi:hypothetical protein
MGSAGQAGGTLEIALRSLYRGESKQCLVGRGLRPPPCKQ